MGRLTEAFTEMLCFTENRDTWLKSYAVVLNREQIQDYPGLGGSATHTLGVLTYCYHLQTKLQKGNVFTSVCQEFCTRGEVRHPHNQPQPLHHHPRQQTATAVDGTHPTGMHSSEVGG